MSLASETREEVRRRPFLLAALRAGVVNYAAAARAIDVSDDTEAVAVALRRFADSLSTPDPTPRDARVTMRGGLRPAGDGSVLSVGGVGYADGDGGLTGVLATGAVDPAALEHVLALLRSHQVPVEAAGTAGDSLVVVVERRDGPAALRLVEDALAGVPE